MASRLRFPTACALGLALAAPAAAAPDGYQHTRWTAENGAPPRIRALAQTTDGWLWLGTIDGLYRFDGLRFERYPLPPRAGNNSGRINELHAAPNGDLVISYIAEGLALLHPDGRVEDLPRRAAPFDPVSSIAVDIDGSVWTAGSTLRHLAGGRWITVADEAEWAASNHDNLLLDAAGRLWAANDHAAWRLDRAAGRFEKVADGGGEPLQAPDGAVWLVDGAGGARRLAGPGPARADAAAAAPGAHWAGQFDPDGALWLLNCPQSACVLPGAARRPAARRQASRVEDGIDGLSGRDARRILLDREGVVWIGTENGLDRFRPSRFLASGLAGTGDRYSLAIDGAGQAWAADAAEATLWRLDANGAAPVAVERGVGVIAAGRDGALLVGRPRAIERRRRAGTETIPLPPGPRGQPIDHHLLGILDDGKVLWTTTLETGLIGWHDGAWHVRADFNLPPRIYQSAPGGPGQLWLATGDGTLVLYDQGRLTTHDIHALGMAAAIFPGAALTLSGDAGFGVMKDGRLRMLRCAGPAILRNVSGLVVAPDGDRWLNGAAGLVHVRADDWRRSIDDPATLLRCELFDAADGYPGRAALESRWASAVSADGRALWLAASGGVVRFDTAALRHTQATRAALLDVAVDDRVHPCAPVLALPAGTDHFRVRYTAPALRAPERQRFEYRLDDVDAGWLDAGTRRATSYTRIGPGDYVFRVRAVDADGRGAGPEATMRLQVAPTLVQTLSFKLACAAAVALAAALAYRYRVRYLTGRLAERLQVRTAERERIARTLHDTFLQTVQGLVLRVDAVAASLPPHDRARRQLETVLDDASAAIGEGRDQLQALRAGDAHVLEDVLADTVAQLRGTHGDTAVELRVDGERRPLSRDASDDIAEIAREALRNAFAHARAAQIRIDLAYGRRALELCVADDGRGIDAAVLRDGARSGHWGLVGMRERAARIGARLEIDSGPWHGTRVNLAVPAAQAYAPE